MSPLLQGVAAVSVALLLAGVGGAGLAGCDDGGRSDRASMRLERSEAPAPRQAETEPTEEAVPVEPEPVAAAPAFIFVDGQRYTFPPAKLYLRKQDGRVRALLLSDDPPEGVRRDYAGDGFYFEMEVDLPPGGLAGGVGTGGRSGAAGGDALAEALADAEWLFRSESSEKSNTPNGIFLSLPSGAGGTGPATRRQLQPDNVAVGFQPLGDFVVVTLDGVFAEFDEAQPTRSPPLRRVRVEATLSAQTLRR